MRLAVALVVLLGVGACRSRDGARRRESATGERGFARFQRLLPVLRHRRCLACHGALDVTRAGEHPAPPVDRDAARRGIGCADCHDAASRRATRVIAADGSPAILVESAWHLPPPERDFVGRSDRALCRQLRDAFPGLPLDPSDLLQHVAHDERIRLAFDGRRALAPAPVSRPPPDPPPTTLAEFTDAVRDWATAGHADCGDDG